MLMHAQLGDGITEKKKAGLFNDAKSMPQIIEAINKAAYDPRVTGIYLKLTRLDLGWGKVQVCPSFARSLCLSVLGMTAHRFDGAAFHWISPCKNLESFLPPASACVSTSL